MHNAQNELRILPIVGKLQNGPSGVEGEGMGGVQIIYIQRYVCSICQMSCLGWIHQAFGVRKYLRLIRRHVAAIIVTKCRTPWARERRSRGEGICGSECQSRWPNIIKTGAREGSNCCCANIGAYKCTENALNCTRHAARRGEGEGWTLHCMNITEVQRAEN